MTRLIVYIGMAAVLGAAHGQENEFRWRGQIAPGRAIEIKGVGGDIRAEFTPGDQVEVVAVKRSRERDPDSVPIRVVEHPGGVTICAVYPVPVGSDASGSIRIDAEGDLAGRRYDDEMNACRPGAWRNLRVGENDVRVDFVVRVPAGVHFIGRAIQGEVAALSLRSPVSAHSMSGDVRVSTSESAEAATLSGDIEASLGRVGEGDPLRFTTLSGKIDLSLPRGTDADLRAESLSGRISADFPLDAAAAYAYSYEYPMKPKPYRRDFRFGKKVTGTVGRGGREIRLQTLSGDIRVRRTP